MSIVAIIPARGGSKGIPRKNLAEIAGRPLISYTIDAAQQAGSVDQVLISTDDNEIANVARQLGAEVPFLRPAELSDDTAPMIGVLRHALDWLELQGVEVEALVLLQPTSPLRTARHVEEAISLFRAAPSSSVVSVVDVPHQFNPVSVMTLSAEGYLVSFLGDMAIGSRRQDKPKVFARNGPVVLVCHPNTIRSDELYGKSCKPYFMSEEDSLDIDDLSDLYLADAVLKKRAEKI